MVNRINNNDYYDYSKLKMPDAADRPDNGEKFSLNYQRAQENKEEKDKKDKTEETEESVAIKPRTVMQGGVRLELSRNGQTTSETERTTAAGRTFSSGKGLLDTVLTWVRGFAQKARAFLYKVWNDEAPPDAVQQGTDDVIEADVAADKDADGYTGAVQSAEVIENHADTASGGDWAGIYGSGSTWNAAQTERLTEEYRSEKGLESLQHPELAAFSHLQREAARNKEIQKYLKSGDLERVLSLATDNGRKTMAKNSSLLTYYDRTGKIAPLSASDQERILHGDRNVKKL